MNVFYQKQSKNDRCSARLGLVVFGWLSQLLKPYKSMIYMIRMSLIYMNFFGLGQVFKKYLLSRVNSQAV